MGWYSCKSLQSRRETPGPILRRNTVCSEVRHGFTQPCTPIRQRSFPFKSLPIHNSRNRPTIRRYIVSEPDRVL